MDAKKRKQDELNRLRCLYYERDKKFEKAKFKRLIITVIGFSAFYLWLLWNVEKPAGWDILRSLVGAIILGGIHVFVNLCIFIPLLQKSAEESETLKRIKNQIEAAENDLHP